jgi:hypothetical protein
MLAGAGRLDRRIQREQIRLAGDLADHLNDVVDLFARLLINFMDDGFADSEPPISPARGQPASADRRATEICLNGLRSGLPPTPTFLDGRRLCGPAEVLGAFRNRSRFILLVGRFDQLAISSRRSGHATHAIIVSVVMRAASDRRRRRLDRHELVDLLASSAAR